ISSRCHAKRLNFSSEHGKSTRISGERSGTFRHVSNVRLGASRNEGARELAVMVAPRSRRTSANPHYSSNLFLLAAALSIACSGSDGSSGDLGNTGGSGGRSSGGGAGHVGS